MTIKDMYEDAVSKGKEDYKIEILYQDNGGCYDGSASMTEFEYKDDHKSVLLI